MLDALKRAGGRPTTLKRGRCMILVRKKALFYGILSLGLASSYNTIADQTRNRTHHRF